MFFCRTYFNKNISAYDFFKYKLDNFLIVYNIEVEKRNKNNIWTVARSRKLYKFKKKV